MFSNTSIFIILLKVKGKTDFDFVTLCIWADDDNKVFCPILHLLIYIYIIGWKSGPLFPCQEELDNLPGIYLLINQLLYI